MNVKEFAALKVGDKIDNPMSQSSGVVIEVNERGVRVRWGMGNTGAITFGYTVQSTAWFHWDKGADEVTCDKCGTQFTMAGPTQCPTCEQS